METDISSVLILAALLGLIPAYIAKKKGENFLLFWIFGAALFIVALPVALMMSPNTKELENKELEAGYKKCPSCAELVKEDAKICRYCRHNF